MASNFNQTSVSKTSKRQYSPITDLETFTEAVNAFVNDTTIGITKKEETAPTYKARINYADADGKDRGYALIYLKNKDSFEAFAAFLEDTTAAEYAGGTGADAVRDETEDAWTRKFSCAIGDDTFTVSISREFMTVSGFSEDSTIEALETWADSVIALGGEIA